MALYAQALRELGRYLGIRSPPEAVADAGGSAAALARSLADGMTLYADRGFYKRAQIVPTISRWPASPSSPTSTG